MCIFTDASLPGPNVPEGIADTAMAAMLSRARDIKVTVSPCQMIVLPCLPPFAMQYAIRFYGAQCSGGSISTVFALIILGEVLSGEGGV